MRLVRTVQALRAALAQHHRPGHRVGFVPTMGALHRGHRTLFDRARTECDHVVASVFVNPKQFDDPGDLAAYPRTEAADAKIAADAGVDVLFIPDADEVFRPGHATSVVVEGAAVGLEGAHRPGHFNGVALVCLKLFSMVRPDLAYFGQKDAQQVAVIRQIVRDLDLDLEIRTVPTVRDDDGLAFSSRNARLSAEERARALALPAALRSGLAAYREGRDPRPPALEALAGLQVDYADVAWFDGEPVLCVAARVGATRLIDNVPLDRPELAGLVVEPSSRQESA